MAENILVLKKRALAAGMDRKTAAASSRAELEAFVSGKKSGTSVAKKKSKSAASEDAPKATKKSTAKKAKKNSKSESAPAEKSATKSGKAKRQTTKATDDKPKRGRPKGSGTKATSKPKASSNGNGDAGRLLIGKLDYVNYDEDLWKPRSGSPVDKIFKMLKKHKDNSEKVFEALKSDVWDYVGKKKDDGSKRTKAEAEALLKYKINQTRWRFGIQTLQHSKAENRIEYGSGSHATKTKKATKAAKRAESNGKMTKAAAKSAKSKTKSKAKSKK